MRPFVLFAFWATVLASSSGAASGATRPPLDQPTAWSAGDPTSPAAAFEIGGRSVVRLPCNFSDGIERAYWDADVALDLAEARGIRTVLGERAGRIPTLAIKGSIGNNGAGAGGIEVAAGALCLKNQTVPASISTETVDPACGLNVVTGRPITGRFNAVLTTAYALGGGQTAALVLKRWEA